MKIFRRIKYFCRCNKQPAIVWIAATFILFNTPDTNFCTYCWNSGYGRDGNTGKTEKSDRVCKSCCHGQTKRKLSALSDGRRCCGAEKKGDFSCGNSTCRAEHAPARLAILQQNLSGQPIVSAFVMKTLFFPGREFYIISRLYTKSQLKNKSPVMRC